MTFECLCCLQFSSSLLANKAEQAEIKRKREEECIICTDNIVEVDKVALQCCHLYHSECVKTLVKKRTRKCPICRTRITWNLEQINKHIKLSKEKFNN